MDRPQSNASSFSISRVEDLSSERRTLKLRLELNGLLHDVHTLLDDVLHFQLDQDHILNNISKHSPISFPLPTLKYAQHFHQIICNLYRSQEIFFGEIRDSENFGSLVEMLVTGQEVVTALHSVQCNHYHILCSSATSHYPDYADRIMSNVDELNEAVTIIDNIIRRHEQFDSRLHMIQRDKVSIIKFMENVVEEESLRLSSFMFRLIQVHVLPKKSGAPESSDSLLTSETDTGNEHKEKFKRERSADSKTTTDSGICALSNESHKLPPIEVVTKIKKQDSSDSNGTVLDLKNFSVDLNWLQIQSQQIYTSFFELQYSIFMQLLDAAGNYGSLIQDETLKQAHKHKGVSWADDGYKQKKRSIWKDYVKKLWKYFVQNLIQNILGNDNLDWVQRASQNQLNLFKKAISVCFTAVPLPDYVVQTSDALDILNHSISENYFEKDFQECLEMAQIDKCLPNESGLTKTGLLLKNMMENYNNSCVDVWRRDKVNQLLQWWLSCKSLKFLTSYDIPQFVMIAFGDATLCPHMQHTLLQRLENKVRHQTLEVLIDSKFLFIIKRKRRKGSNETNYIGSLGTAVLEPIWDSLGFLNDTDRHIMIELVSKTVINTWMEYLIESGVKLRPKQASNILDDLDNFMMLLKANKNLTEEESLHVQNLKEVNIFEEGLYSLTSRTIDKKNKVDMGALDHNTNHTFAHLRQESNLLNLVCCCLCTERGYRSNKISHQHI